jgi:hypothetical protein
MNCKVCSANAKTVTKWNGSQPEDADIYSIWRCENGHHFYTRSQWQEGDYKTDFIDPKDLPSVTHFH